MITRPAAPYLYTSLGRFQALVVAPSPYVLDLFHREMSWQIGRKLQFVLEMFSFTVRIVRGYFPGITYCTIPTKRGRRMCLANIEHP